MKTVRIGGSTIQYVDQGRGPVLLLVHGFPLDHSMWKYQIEELAKQYRVLCPDLPGFGSSDLGAKTISLRQMADDLARLLDALNIAKATFCGLSMGGYIGWQFWKHHADRLDALIACDTRSAADSDVVARGRRISAESVRESGSGSIAGDMLPKLFHAESLASQKTEAESVRQVISTTAPESIAQAQLAMAERPDATSWLAQINLPTLFVVGQFDSITPPDEMRRMADQVKQSKFVEIKHSGHLSPLENPTDFNQAVIEFLDHSLSRH